MGMSNIAGKYSSQAFAAGALTLTVESNEPVTVFGILLSNQSGGVAAFTIADGAGTTIQVVELADGTTTSVEVCWKAHTGLRITGVANTSATVFHSSPGN